MTALWTIGEICRATDGRAIGLDDEAPINGVSIDSRTLDTNDLFVAIKGDRFDGHDFVDKAWSAGLGQRLLVSHTQKKILKRKSSLSSRTPWRGLNSLVVLREIE